MNNSSYKLIFWLLTSSVLCILALQTFWLFNSYKEKSEEFNRSVYDALEEIGTKLRDRKNLASLKTTYLIDHNNDTIIKNQSRNQVIMESDGSLEINRSPRQIRVREINANGENEELLDSVYISEKKSGTEISVQSRKIRSVINSGKKKTKKATIQKQHFTISVPEAPEMPHLPVSPDSLVNIAALKKDLKDIDQLGQSAKEMAALVDKMMTEIIVLHTETRHPDTIKALIKSSLDNRGLFLPFEFSLQKSRKDSNEILAQSMDFKERADNFKSDLSGSNVIPNREFLFLQFNNKNDVVMAGMKSSIILSLLFSLLIISIFYYVMRLIRKQKKMSDIKNDFINNMTHELKTPIATISLAVDAMNNPEIKNNAQRSEDYSRILKEETKKLNNHVERVLQVALLDKGALLLQKQNIDLVALLKETVRNYQLQILEKEAVVNIEGPESIWFEGDKTHLSGLFSNLLDNALKYSAHGKTISIAAREHKGNIEVMFKDQGIGMHEEQQKKIFDKFYRAQGGNLHDVKGFGLGLSYVKSIVEAHGGTISVKSRLGSGSEFLLKFIVDGLSSIEKPIHAADE